MIHVEATGGHSRRGASCLLLFPVWGPVPKLQRALHETHLLCWNAGFEPAITPPPPAQREGCTPEAALLRLTALLPPLLPLLLLVRKIELGWN